ncbi:MAG: DUF2190 family protein [Isosphaeraceae bacterium]
MATATLVSVGNAIDYTPGSALAAGDIVDMGDCIGIAVGAIAANALGSLDVGVEVSVYDITKYTGEAINLFDDVYYDAGTNTATKTSGYSEARIGKCVKAALAGDATVRVMVFPRTG